MTDRELLELAARAAGVEINAVIGDTFWRPDGITWNPLTDDGDALRLAVQLNIEWAHIDDRKSANAGVWAEQEYPSKTWNCVTPYNGDKLTAVRRAIVRAAAEIGKDMK